MAELTQLERDELPLVARVKEWLSQKYGSIQSFEKVPSPHEHRAYYPVAFVTFAGGRELVAKWSPKTEKLGKEFQVCKLLLAHDIPTTIPVDYDSSVVIFTMERLAGHSLTEAELTPTTAGEMGAVLRRLHGLDTSKAEQLGIPAWEGETFQDEVTVKFYERFKGARAHLPKDLAPEVVERAFRLLVARTTWQGQRGLNRRDAHPENWFRLAGGGLAPIDHGNASVGDISYDLAHMVTEFKQRPELTAAFRDAYGSELFDQAASQDLQAISNLLHGLGMIWWVKNYGVPQPQYETEAHAFMRDALGIAER